MTGRGKKEIKRAVSDIAALSSFRIEASRSSSGMAVFVSGIIGVENFSDTNIVLMSHGGRVSLSGQRLSLGLYENNTVEISGRVEEMCFKYGKN